MAGGIAQPRSHQWVSWFVPTIVMVNIGLFVYEMYVNDCPRNSQNCIGTSSLRRFAFQSTKENPLLGPSPSTLLKMGAQDVNQVVEKKEVWRLFTCIWLHAGVFHVLANMLSLLFVGISMEQEFGFVRIGLLYIISGVGGSLLSCLFVRNTISVGASGALFGLLGAMLSELLTNWTIYERKCGALFNLIIVIVINLAVGILPHVDNFAHVGGFLTGFFLGFLLLIRPRFGYVSRRNAHSSFLSGKKKSKYNICQLFMLVCSLVILIVGFGFGFFWLLKGIDGNAHCSWCHYLSCVPTPLWNCNEPNEAANCEASQIGSQLTLKCLANQKSGSFVVVDQNNTALLQTLCSQLCSM